MYSRTPGIGATAYLLLVLVGLQVLSMLPAGAEPGACDHDTDAGAILAALTRISATVDPCGESPLVSEVLETLSHCPSGKYHICTDPDLSRNLFDRPAAATDGDEPPGIIHWNPALGSELELGCDGNATKPVLRDPTASLLHELAHAADDCLGIDPSEREINAVRIENIYRRAAGLCQRTRYGESPLPPQFVRSCSNGQCSCSSPPSTLGGA